jgi:hypothetical protein
MKLATFTLTLALTGCATLTTPVFEAYWIPGVYAPATGPERVVFLADIGYPCQSKTASGCYDYSMDIIYIKSGMPPQVTNCILNQERAHRKGWGHGNAPASNHCAVGLI